MRLHPTGSLQSAGTTPSSQALTEMAHQMSVGPFQTNTTDCHGSIWQTSNPTPQPPTEQSVHGPPEEIKESPAQVFVPITSPLVTSWTDWTAKQQDIEERRLPRFLRDAENFSLQESCERPSRPSNRLAQQSSRSHTYPLPTLTPTWTFS